MLQLIRHRLVKNTAALMVVQVAGYVAPFLVLPYLARILSKEHFGLIAYATAFNQYFMVLVDYGFNLTATRRIAINRDDPEKISQIYSSVIAAKALLTLLGVVILFTVVLATPKLRPNLPIFCISYLAVIGDLLFPMWLFQGLQKMENLVWRDLLARLVSLGMMFAFVHKDGDYLWAAGFQAGSMLLAGIIGLITVPLLTPARFVVPSRTEIFGALREGWPVFLSMAALSMSWATNVLILGLRSGPEDVAYYSASFRLITAARMLVTPIVTALYPHISHMAVASGQNAVAFLRKYALILAAPFLAGSLILFVGAPLIIHIVYSAKYDPSILLLRIMAFSPFLLVFQMMYSTFYMLAFGYEKEWSRIIMQSTVLNFVVLIPLMFSIWPPAAVSITGVVVDIFAASATYRFFRKTTAAAPAMVTA
ncbi:MAG TPA: flippase [Bryobacteraceae bacterium]|jgi:PST family polysaccharide transporter